MRTRSNLCYGEDSQQPMLNESEPRNPSWWKSKKTRPARRNTISNPTPPPPSPPPRPPRKRPPPSKPAKKRPTPTKRQKVTKPKATATATTEPPAPRRRSSIVTQETAIQPQPAAVPNTLPPPHRMPARRHSVFPGMLTAERSRDIAAKIHHQKLLDLMRSLQQTAYKCNKFEGYRILQIDHFLGWATFQQFLHRKICPEGLYRPSCEYRAAVHSVFELQCNRCASTVRCATEEYDHPNPLTLRMMMVMLQWPGMGYSEMASLMESMEIPFFTEDQYHHLESEILSYETLDPSFIKEEVDADSLLARYSSPVNLQSMLREASVTFEQCLSGDVAPQGW